MFICSSVFSKPIIEGVWKENCERNWSNIYNSQGRPSMMLEASHAYIYIRYSYSDTIEGGINIYFDETADLGPGGREVNWDNIDRERVIGIFKLLGKRKATLDWFGFNDKSGNKIEVYSDFKKRNELIICK
jgi:hypothetical protein